MKASSTKGSGLVGYGYIDGYALSPSFAVLSKFHQSFVLLFSFLLFISSFPNLTSLSFRVKVIRYLCIPQTTAPRNYNYNRSTRVFHIDIHILHPYFSVQFLDA